MRKGNTKKYMATFLSFVFALSLAGCGKKEVVVDEYAKGAETKQSTSTDAQYSKGDGKTLQEKFGKWAKWKDSFAIQGVQTDVNTSIPIPDAEYLNVYKKKTLVMDKAFEDRIVKALFGDTAEKLDEIKYTNDTDYITFLYKYREIYHQIQGDIYNYFNDAQSYRSIMGSIDSSFEDVYKWVDEDKKYYIHMYEGKYEGTRYGLLIAYDYTKETGCVFFDPISIKDVFPDSDYRTILYEGNGDTLEKTQDIKNECSLSKEEVTEKAESFLRDKIGIDDIDNNIAENSDLYHMMSGLGTTKYVDDNSMTRLVFTDADYYNAMMNVHMQSARGVGRLAAQDDLLADEMEKHNNDYYDALFANTTLGSSDTTFTRNGYAVYLTDPSVTLINRGDTLIFSGGNTGMIKVTDKGILGADLILYNVTEEVVENVELLDFDKIQESLKGALEEKLDMKKLGDPKKLSITGTALMYEQCEQEDENGQISMIPVWTFTVNTDHIKSGPDGIEGVVSISINAMDGSVNSYIDDGGFIMNPSVGDGETSVEVNDDEDGN